jgi:hypothetical protein
MKIRPPLNCKNNKGFIEIVIALLVLAIGAFVIYQLLGVIHKWNNRPKNDDTTIYEYPDGSVSSSLVAAGVTNHPAIPTQDAVLPSSLTTNSFCTFQYRVLVDSNGVPYTTLVMGTNMMDGQVTELINTTNEYAVTFVVGSQVYYQDYDANTDEAISDTVTPAYTGDPFIATVQRSTNSIWRDIFTNDPCQAGIIYTFTDPQPPACSATYRLKLTQ